MFLVFYIKKNSLRINILLILFLIISVLKVFSQDSLKQLKLAEAFFKDNTYKKAKRISFSEIKKDSKQIDFNIFLGKIYAKSFKMDSSTLWLNKAKNLINYKTSNNQLFQYFLWTAYNFEVNKNYDKALENYFLAKKKSKTINDIYYLDLLYNRVLLIYSENEYKQDVNNWILTYTKFKDSLNNNFITNNYHNTLGKHFHYNEDTKNALFHFDQNIYYSKKNNDSVMLSNAYFHKGIIYSEYTKYQDSARFYFAKGKDICACDNNILFQATYKYNVAQTYIHQKNNIMSKAWLFSTLQDSVSSRKTHIKNNVLKDLYKIYKSEKNIDSAFYYLELHKIFSDSLKISERNNTLAELQTKYDTEKKEKENLLLKTNIEKEQQQKKILFISALALILFGTITAFLIQKNTRKKQKLAEQEKALETQKLETVLKEQELVSIDAMIEGQEKERQRIANDLHDDLGGLMATVKLHFNVLKDKQTPELFDKTTNLLDEAYNKIRGIAHAKNSGVIAKQGLLKAVQNMADKISVSNKITVDVIDHGLENRLENSLELTIFRIIQELITNVIKHADASEATIHLTNHDDTLNIMIEDNGVGFNPNQVTTKNKGMGISSIDKRIEHLNGKMTIESEHNKGTTIIIDLPI